MLTDRLIRTARVRAGLNQRELRDQKVQGLVCRVYKTGVRVWFLFYRRKEDDRRRHLKLGVYPGVSLAQARELAEIALGKIAGGEDPQAQREELRAQPPVETLAELAKAYLAEYAEVQKRPAGYRMDRWQLDTYVLARWGRRRVTEITKGDVQQLLEDVASGKLAARGKPTKVAPRNLKALLSKLFDWAADRGVVPGNPAAGVKLPSAVREHLKRGGRDRVLTDAETRTLWEALDGVEADPRNKSQGAVTAAAFRLILLTAQRPGEVLSMRWRDIEDDTWWVVPAEVAKNGEANRVYLSPQAREILRGLRRLTGRSGWVLESRRRRGFPLTTVKTAQAAIVRRTGIRHWTPHDLRRTAASKMSAEGVPRRVLQAILNHKDRSVTAVYDRYSLDRERREALTAWGRRVEEIVGGGAPGTVVPFPARLPPTGRSGNSLTTSTGDC